MQRRIALLLAMLFSFMLILPAFAAPSSSNLPACCRKGGKHHCSMGGETEEHGIAFATLSEKCPMSSQVGPTAQIPFHSPAAPAVLVIGVTAHSGTLAQVQAGYRISFHRARLKRGPPSLLFS